MFIKEIRLRNFRGFDETKIQFSERFTVIAGENGCGKTAILEGICVALGGWLFGFDGIEARDKRNILISDKRVIYSKVNGAPLVQVPTIVECDAVVHDREFSWERSITSRNGHTTYGGLFEIKKYANELNEKIFSTNDNNINLPVIAYYSAARLWNEPIQREKRFKKPKVRLSGYNKAISFSNSIKDAMNYIDKLAYIAENDEFSKKRLGTILLAISKSISNVGYSEIIYNKKYGELCALQVDNSYTLYSNLSDGYRCIVSLVTDICVRLATLNPHLEGEELLALTGVILIDEIDLHLHPKWQRIVIEDLKNIFPKLQFIVTTHSPFIIQSLKHGELINIGLDEEVEYENESLEDIAENVMGIENAYTSKYREKMYLEAQEYYRLLENVTNSEELENVKRSLDVLTARYSDDPAYYAFLMLKFEEKKMIMTGVRK